MVSWKKYRYFHNEMVVLYNWIFILQGVRDVCAYQWSSDDNSESNHQTWCDRGLRC